MPRPVLRAVAAIVLVLVGGGCGSSVATVAPASQQPRATSYEEFGVAMCSAFEELFTAVGNPDTAEHSALFEDFKAAIETGDAPSVDRAANTIRQHLETGRGYAAAAAGWEPSEPMMVQLDRLLVAFEAMVEAMRVSVNQPGNMSVGQTAFEQAGGLEAWRAMFEAGRQMDRPANRTEKRCPTVPLCY